MNHIREKLPDMKARLNTLMGQAQQELNSFGDSAIFGDKNQASIYFQPLLCRCDFLIPITARIADPPPHDPIRARFHRVDRGHES